MKIHIWLIAFVSRDKMLGVKYFLPPTSYDVWLTDNEEHL